MTDKAYIVANEEQEREVLEKLEREGLVWFDGGEKPTEWIPSQKGTKGAEFPYVLLDDGEISWKFLNDLSDEEIAFDGRKESKMSDKYVVSQEFMNELEEWKKRGNTEVYFVGSYYLSMLPDYIKRWWNYPEINNFECNNRLIAIIRWVNGEDVFEAEKPKKWVVRSNKYDNVGDHLYVEIDNRANLEHEVLTFSPENATKFDTREEAESWANAHQEVIEVEA